MSDAGEAPEQLPVPTGPVQPVQIPRVPDNATVDEPPEQERGPIVPAPDDPEEAKHRRGMDRVKLKFAFWLIGVSVGLAAAMSVVQAYLPPVGNGGLGGIVDMLKLIATTALGFVFGRTLGRGDN